MFTPGQVSDMLDIPPSTLRRYAREFAEFLEEGAQKSRGRRFSQRDIATIKRIRELLGKGRSPEEVEALLPVMDSEPDKGESGDLFALAVPEAAEAIQALEDKADSLRIDLSDAKRIIAAEFIRLRHVQGEHRSAVEAMREWADRPWYERLFTSPDIPEPTDPPEEAAREGAERLLGDRPADPDDSE